MCHEAFYRAIPQCKKRAASKFTASERPPTTAKQARALSNCTPFCAFRTRMHRTWWISQPQRLKSIQRGFGTSLPIAHGSAALQKTASYAQYHLHAKFRLLDIGHTRLITFLLFPIMQQNRDLPMDKIQQSPDALSKNYK